MTEKVLVSLIEEVLEERKKKEAGKKDACYHKVKSRYKKWPSAYGSGALVKCRKAGAENWGNSTNEELALDEEELFEILLDEEDEEDETLEEKKRKLTKKPSSETSLRDWFKRKGEPGKGGGWVDCNSPIRKDGKKTGYKSCGRTSGEERSKYPACRPTPSACKSKGKGKKWGKEASEKRNESMNNLQKLIESEVLSLLNEASDEKLVKMNSLDFLLLTRMKPGDKENDPELQQKLNNLGLNNELNNLAWVNPVNLRKNYNEYINNDPLYLKFKLKDNGSYETIEHEGRHRNLGNLLANGKDASMNVVLKGDIPPSGTNVQRQGMEGGVPVELEYKETSNEKPPENLDDHLNKEIDLSNLFTIIKKIALDDIKKNKGEDEAALFSKSFGEFIKTFNENYGIKLKDLKGNEEFYELEVGGSFIKKLQLRDSAGANHGRSLNTTEGANVDENEAGSASNYTGTPYEATLVKKNISEGGSMNNLQEQILTEVMQLLESTNISEGMQYHLDNKIPITETIYRPLSDGFMRLMKEARTLHSLGLYEGLTEDEREILESDLGEVGVYEGQEVPLDLLMVEEEELDEAKYKGKDVKLNKPQRGGSKKFYVYVRDPKSGNIRKVSFGARGMSVKLNDPKRRKAFVDRHRCKEKKNKTTAGYWACRIGRYPHLFGGNTKYTWW